MHILQEQKSNKKYKNCLEPYHKFETLQDLSYEKETKKFICNGMNFNMDRITENTKRYFFDECIPLLVNSHNENFDKIALIFSEAFKVKFTDKIQEDVNMNIFEEDMRKIINDSLLHFPVNFCDSELWNKNHYASGDYNASNLFNKKGNIGNAFNFNGFSGFSNFSPFKENEKFEEEKNSSGEYKYYIFFGDEIKIKKLIEIVIDKYRNLFVTKTEQNRGFNPFNSGNFSDRGNYQINNFERNFYKGKNYFS